MTRTGSSYCRVCGYEPAEPPWGTDGMSPSFDYCPCCGVEWGYQDSSQIGTVRFRSAWLEEGGPWRDPRFPLDGLDVAERLRRIGVEEA